MKHFKLFKRLKRIGIYIQNIYVNFRTQYEIILVIYEITKHICFSTNVKIDQLKAFSFFNFIQKRLNLRYTNH